MEERLEREAPRGGMGAPSEQKTPSTEVRRIPTDNWKHRSTRMICGTCMFNVGKPTSKPQREDHFIGRCRRNAPTMQGWPVVFSDDWCGNHKLDEEKA